MKLSCLALVLALLSGAQSAHAARRLSLTLEGCAAWSPSEVERLAQLELGTVGGGESDVGSADVRVACQPGEALITATEPRSRRALSRRLELGGSDDAPRLVGISVAQLVRALDWLPEPEPAPAPKPAAAPKPPSPPPPQHRLELRLGAGPRARDQDAAFATYRAVLGSSFELRRGFALGGAFSYERGEARRSLGDVRAELLGVAAQAGLEPWRGRHWSCLFRLELGLARLSLRGAASDVGVGASRVSGFGGQAELGAGPVLRLGELGVSLLAQAGLARFGGQALIEGDAPVSLNGAWAGAELGLLWSP